MVINKVAVLIKKASLVFDKKANPIFARYNLTSPQYKVLKYIYYQDSRTARVVDLEEEFYMTHPTAIELVNQLEKKGFVKRKVNIYDKRGKLIALTKKSDVMQKKLEKVGDEIEELLTKSLTKKERKELIKLLNKVIS